MNPLADVWLLVALLAFAVGTVAFIAAIVRWPGFGLTLASLFAVIHWEFPRAPAAGEFFGFEVYTDDLVLVALLGATVVNLVRGKVRLASIHWAALVLTASLGVSLLVGLSSGSAGAVIVEARPVVFVAIAAVWALTLTWTSEVHRLATIRRVAMSTALALTAAAAYHIARYGLGRVDEFIVNSDGTVGQTSRPLTAAQTMMLLVALCAVVGTSTRLNRRLSVAVVMLGVLAIFASQQRTAWVALLAVGIVLWLRASGTNRVRTLGIAGLLAGVAVNVVAGGWASRVMGSTLDAALGGGTYEGRISGWTALIRQSTQAGADAVAFGRPFGSGYGRYEGPGLWVEWAPHNHYLTVFLRAGVVGLVALVWFLMAALRRSLAIAHGGWVTATWVAVAIMCWTYTLSWFLVPLAVVALGIPMVAPESRQHQRLSSLRRAPWRDGPRAELSQSSSVRRRSNA